MTDQRIRAIFVALLGGSFGELTSALALAERVTEDGGEVCFLASPGAAKIIESGFPYRVSTMTPSVSTNHGIWWQAVRDFRPNVVVFSEVYEFFARHMYPGYPSLINWKWLKEIEGFDGCLVWIDVMGFMPFAEKSLARLSSPPRFMRSFLERLQVMLPCPSHDPAVLEGREGFAYRSIDLPLRVDPGERERVRAQYLGEPDGGFLILHATGQWLRRLAETLRLPLYHYLSELLGAYLADLPKPVTLVDIADLLPRKPYVHGNFKVITLKSMPPRDFEALLLASDLMVSENLWSYGLAKTLGNVTPLVLANSYALEELMKREAKGSQIRALIEEMDRKSPGAIYPHLCYPLPLRLDASLPAWGPLMLASDLAGELASLQLISEPYCLKAELYGGEPTRELFRRALCDPSERLRIKERQMEYIERQAKLPDGATVLRGILSGALAGQSLLESG